MGGVRTVPDAVLAEVDAYEALFDRCDLAAFPVLMESQEAGSPP